jgi:tryptophan-rich sensory protein
MIVMKIDVKKLLFSIILCMLAGIIGSVFTTPAIPGWYASLQKPFFSPPNWAFAPVWTTLYFLMGISLYLVITKKTDKKVRIGLYLFGIQLFLNIAWLLLFFGLRNPFYGLIGIAALWIFILLTIIQFWKISRRAAYLLVPYLIWVTIASFLNYYVWILNV